MVDDVFAVAIRKSCLRMAILERIFQVGELGHSCSLMLALPSFSHKSIVQRQGAFDIGVYTLRTSYEKPRKMKQRVFHPSIDSSLEQLFC